MPHLPDHLPATPPDGRYGDLLRRETEQAERDAAAKKASEK